MENGAVESRLLASTKANLPTQNGQFSKIGKLSGGRSGVTVLSATAGMEPLALPSPHPAVDEHLEEGQSGENDAKLGVNLPEVGGHAEQGGLLAGVELPEDIEYCEGEVDAAFDPNSCCANGEGLTSLEGQNFAVTEGAMGIQLGMDGNHASIGLTSSGDSLGDAQSQGAANEQNSQVEVTAENREGVLLDDSDLVGGTPSLQGMGGTISSGSPVKAGTSETGGDDDFADFGDFTEAVGSGLGSNTTLRNLDNDGSLVQAGTGDQMESNGGGFDDFGDFPAEIVPAAAENAAPGNSDTGVEEPDVQRVQSGGAESFGDFVEPGSTERSGGAENFGDFVEPGLTKQSSGEASQSSDADFGEFAKVDASTSPTRDPGLDDNFSDFGDFAEAEASTSTAQPGAHEDTESDDFGDFGEFSEASATSTPPGVQGLGTQGSLGAGSVSDVGAGGGLDRLMSMTKGDLMSAVSDILKPLLSEPIVAGHRQNTTSTLAEGVTLKSIREIKFRLPPESALGANLLQVKPVPPGFLRGCGPPAVLAARVARTEQKLLRSLGLLDAYTRASMEEQLAAETNDPVSGSESFRGILESGSIASLLETPRIAGTPVATEGDLDFLVQASAGSGVLPAPAKSDLSFSSTGDALAGAMPANSSGSPSPTTTRHKRDLSSIFDTLADLAPIIPGAAETDDPGQGEAQDEPGMEPPKPKVSIEPVKSLDMWGMGELTTLEAASAQAAEPPQCVDGDFGGLDDLVGPSAEIQKALQGSILVEGSDSGGAVDLKSMSGNVSADNEQLPISSGATEVSGPETGIESENDASMSADFGDFVGGGGQEEGATRTQNPYLGLDAFGGFVGNDSESVVPAANKPVAMVVQGSGSLEPGTVDAPSTTSGAEPSSFPGFNDFPNISMESVVPSPSGSIATQLGGVSAGADGFGDFLAGGKTEPPLGKSKPDQTEQDCTPTQEIDPSRMNADNPDIGWGGFESPSELSPSAGAAGVSHPSPELPEPESLFTDDWVVSLKGNKKPDGAASSITAHSGNQPEPVLNGTVDDDDGEWGDFSTATDPQAPNPEAPAGGDSSDPFGFLSQKLGFSPRTEVEPPKPVQPKRVAMKDMAPITKKGHHVGVMSGGLVSTKPLELFDGLDMAGDEAIVQGGAVSDFGGGYGVSFVGQECHSISGVGVVGLVPGKLDEGDDDEWGGFQGT